MAYPTILHHFDASPFSEKIRVIFGFKGISWQSVRIPRIMPKPDLMPLTGGYRRTPVMQIGADVFCDTQIIIREIERRFPSPTLFPSGDAGVPWALALWTDRTLFQNAVSLVFGTLGPRFRGSLSRIAAGSAEPASTLRGCGRRFRRCAISFAPIFGWIEAQLNDGRTWLLGDFSLADVSAYMNVWYVRSSLVSTQDQAVAELDKIFARLPRVAEWESRMRAVGHGRREEMSAEEALAVAAKASPETVAQSDPDDPNGRKVGDRVLVVPDDYGKVEVSGEIVSLSAQHIAIRRIDELVGKIVVHFPRAGFLVLPD